MENHPVILFDGVCNLCNNAVRFVIKRDPKSIFRFASLQSDFGKKIIAENHLSEKAFSSFILLEKDKIYFKSTAALRVIKKLNGVAKLLYVFIILPAVIRNVVYDFIAANRYKWFGKLNDCMVPGKENMNRFK
ncbi:MAG: DCC1-like thiol-disulfide oxidoreductase family protein [Bacteroidota bacterium]